MSVATLQKTGSPEERRRHVRQKTHAVTCVKLDNDNGGILLNLGTGGLSFQAVSQVDRDRDLILHFKLPDCTEEIQLRGSVTWLGPTRKDAGICFRDLPDSTLLRISEWIEKQGTPSAAKGLKAASRVKPSATTRERPVPLPRPEIKPVPSRLPIAEQNLNPSPFLPSEPAWGVAPSNIEASGPIAPVVLATSLTPMPTLPIHIEEDSTASIANPNTRSPEKAQTMFNPRLHDPSKRAQENSGKVETSSALLEFPSSTVAAVRTWWFRPVLILTPAARKRNRPNLIVAALTACIVILGLIVISPDYRGFLEQIYSSVSSELNSLHAIAKAPDPPADGASLESQERTMASPAAPSDSLSDPAPIPAPHKFARTGTKAAWLSVFKKMFPGIKNPVASDEALAGVQVWTHKRSGYYYCTDSPFFEKLRPGSLMTQSDALQSGYQPKLGSYCE
jgi:hypothetical protein